MQYRDCELRSDSLRRKANDQRATRYLVVRRQDFIFIRTYAVGLLSLRFDTLTAGGRAVLDFLFVCVFPRVARKNAHENDRFHRAAELPEALLSLSKGVPKPVLSGAEGGRRKAQRPNAK